MRIRPFFWTLLALVCASVLVFAVVVTNNRAYPLQAQIEQVLTNPTGVAVVHFRLTDTEDQPVERATILLGASMPAMPMEPPAAHVQTLGRGRYLARFYLSMTGVWHLTLQVSAPGFLPAHWSITLQVRY